jgi:hypothetical protein
LEIAAVHVYFNASLIDLNSNPFSDARKATDVTRVFWCMKFSAGKRHFSGFETTAARPALSCVVKPKFFGV